MKKRLFAFLIAMGIAIFSLPSIAFAADEIGYYEATAAGRPYNGTNTVPITDMVFAGILVGDDVSADGEGFLSSPNAGTYTTIDGTHFILKRKDKDWYTVNYDQVFLNLTLKTPVTISKAEPQFQIQTVQSVYCGDEFAVTATLVNDFHYEEGIPTAQEISIQVSNAEQKPGTSVTRANNQYSAVFVATKDTSQKNMTVSVNVLDTAVNYAPLSVPCQLEIPLRSFASYAEVDAAIEKANQLNKNDYVDFSGVETAIAAVIRGKDSSEQSQVDAMAAAIEKAISSLIFKPADYAKVNDAIDKANELVKENYSNFSIVQAAVDAVIWDKNITQQSDVDAMAIAIENAISSLIFKPADYAKVNDAIDKANELVKENYSNFSIVQAAVDAVIWDKNITQQSDVDAMATAIMSAINLLQKKPDVSSTIPEDSSSQTSSNSVPTTVPSTGGKSAALVIGLLFISACGLSITIFRTKKKPS